MEGRAPWIADKEKITAVTIENGVTYVGAYAFDHCKKLTQITIHAQLNSIGKAPFVIAKVLPVLKSQRL